MDIFSLEIFTVVIYFVSWIGKSRLYQVSSKDLCLRVIYFHFTVLIQIYSINKCVNKLVICPKFALYLYSLKYLNIAQEILSFRLLAGLYL